MCLSVRQCPLERRSLLKWPLGIWNMFWIVILETKFTSVEPKHVLKCFIVCLNMAKIVLFGAKHILKGLSREPKICISALLGSRTCSVLSSWEPDLILGSQNKHLSVLLEDETYESAILGAKTRSIVLCPVPKRVLNQPSWSQNKQRCQLAATKCVSLPSWEL